MPPREIEENLDAGVMVVSVMTQALAQGLSFITTEINRMGLIDQSGMLPFALGDPLESALDSMNHFRYFLAPAAIHDQIDQIRLLVLITFDQTFRIGEIGVGSGSSSKSSMAMLSMDEEGNVNIGGVNVGSLHGGNNPSTKSQESRRERRRKIDRADTEIPFEVGFVINIILFVFC